MSSPKGEDPKDPKDVVTRKRAHSEVDSSETQGTPSHRIRLNSKDTRHEYGGYGYGKSNQRWMPHGVTEDYVNVVGEIMYPPPRIGQYGFKPEEGRFPMERMNTLGYLLCPLRPRLVIEKWSPFEVSVFEASITLHGKNFNRIQKYVKTKTVQEVIEFYYTWKKTHHYKEWKKTYTPDDRDAHSFQF